MNLQTMNGQFLTTLGSVQLSSIVSDGMEIGPSTAHVVSTLPLGVDMVLGLSSILQYGCWIGRQGEGICVQWGSCADGIAAKLNAAQLKIEDDDFVCCFSDGAWHVKWKWRKGAICHQGGTTRIQSKTKRDQDLTMKY